ncbi:PRC-barrel domain-containing protein [Halomonas sp. E19]|uniref:PRC-barrel domain-containing protein n=1 Tax=unclassified Halomonas TaxID=2609666 RepID=UPI004034878E
MKRTAIAIAVGALSTGLAHGVLAQDDDAQQHLGEQHQMTQEGEQNGQQNDEVRAGEGYETGFNAQGQGGQDADTTGDNQDRANNDDFDVDVEQEPAEVSVDQEPAEIRVEQEPPEVTVEQQAPNVTIDQPDPEVDVDQAEPEVTVDQEGEANVRVEEADEATAEIRSDDDDDADREQREQQGLFDDDGDRDRDQAGQQDLGNMQVSDLEGRTLVTQDGEEIGEIDRVVRDTQENATYVVVSEGGFLGFGGDEMAYPLQDIQVRDDDGEVLLQSRSGERNADDFDDDRYEELDGDERLGEVR